MSRVTIKGPSRFELMVVGGAGLGLRLTADEKARVVGRGAGVDLPLTDLRVSRRHLEVTAIPGGIRLAVMTGASPMLVNGEPRSAHDAHPGEQIIVGETVLAVAEVREEEPAPAGHAERTEVRTLFGGVASDARGLAAVFELGETLERARDRASIEATVASWARRQVGATAAALHVADDVEVEPATAARLLSPGALVVEATSGGTTVTVPAFASPAGVLVFTLPGEPGAVTEQARRLLVIAGRVCALSLARARSEHAMDDERRSLRQLAVGSAREFVGSSEPARELSKLISRLSTSDVSALLLGETGSGKTFTARLIHEGGPRAGQPFRVLNCAAIPEALLESELFGHERGAFSGATATRVGAFEAAGEGTLLLDEIGELALPSQAKLLRALEDRRFERIGSNREIHLRARVLAATNRDLAAWVESGRFRADLFFRLSVVTVQVPPLRDRPDDLVDLAHRMLADLAPSAGRRVTGFSPASVQVLRSYSWPGNARELRNAIERALVLGDGALIEPFDLPSVVRAPAPRALASAAEPEPEVDADVVRLPASLESIEARAIESALRATGGNRTRAAAILGIHRMTLLKKMREPAGD